MRLTFLGTATSHGIPMIGCDCAVCRSPDPRNQRLRPSVLVETDSARVLIDATPDLRTQALRAGLRRLDAVLLTHAHADHILGLDDLRIFCEHGARKMPVYGSADCLAVIRQMFPYACTEKPAWPGLPSFLLREVAPDEEWPVGDLSVRTLAVPHGQMTVYGFLLGGQMAYVTDCHAVPSPVIEALRGVPVLVLDALRHRPHPTHLTVAQALEVAQLIGPQITLLTHICHELDHPATEAELPAEVRMAFDGMRIDVQNGEWLMVNGEGMSDPG